MKKRLFILLMIASIYVAESISLASDTAPIAEETTQAKEVDNNYLLKNDISFNMDGIVNTFGENGNINDVKYRFSYVNGSGRFSSGSHDIVNCNNDSNWRVQCYKDPITDKKNCLLHKYDLWIFVYGNMNEIVSIGDEHYPGSLVSIRVNKSKPITTSSQDDGSFSPLNSKRIIEQLLNDGAKIVTTRYMKWPYRKWEEQELGLYGFNEAYSYIKWAIKRIK